MWVNRHFRFALIAVALLVSAAYTVSAQSTGTIDGTLLDASHASISGADVTLSDLNTGRIWKAKTSQGGYFSFQDLQPGRYSVNIAASGFKALLLQPLVLTVGQTMTLHPSLALGTITQHVQVLGTPPPVDTESASVSQLVDTHSIEQLPLNGRNALQLVSLVPGVVSTGTAGQFGATQVTFSSSGGRDIDMNFQLDGGFNMDSFYGIANEYPNPDALQEFSVGARNYSAAFGRGSTSISAVTKSGTNNSWRLEAPQRRMKMGRSPGFGAVLPKPGSLGYVGRSRGRRGRFILARSSPCTNMVRDACEAQRHVASAVRRGAREGISLFCERPSRCGRGGQK